MTGVAFGWLVWMTAFEAPASACGGFFCSSGGYTTTTTITGDRFVPVEQNAERILFRVNPDDTVTTFVEVGFEQLEDVDFAWVIPIPEPIDPTSVATSGADLFNALELATAPRFTFHWTQTNYVPSSGGGGGGGYFRRDDGEPAGGCGCGGAVGESSSGVYYGGYDAPSTGGGYSETTVTEEVAVQVVAESVVGPFAIEVITATDAVEFAAWLDANGYDLPDDGVEPLQHYVDLGMAYLGVKLAPTFPEGPIDTLQFTYPATMPMIPIVLTAVASADDLPITAYILADDPYIPIGWSMTREVAPDTLPDGLGGTDYVERLGAEIDRYDGQAFTLEYAQPTSSVPELGDPALDALVAERGYLVRWRGDISPSQMTLDPEFVPEVGLPAYDNVHDIDLDFAYGSTTTRHRAWLLLALPIGALGWLRRRVAR